MVVSDLWKVKRRSIVVGVCDVNYRVAPGTGTGNSIGGTEAGRHGCPDGDFVQCTLLAIQRFGRRDGAGYRVQPKRKRFSASGRRNATGSGIEISNAGVGELVEGVEVAIYGRHVADAGPRRFVLVDDEAVDRKRENRKLIVDVGDREMDACAPGPRGIPAAVRRDHVEHDPRQRLPIEADLCRNHPSLRVDPEEVFYFRFGDGRLQPVGDDAIRSRVGVDCPDLQ